MRKRKGSFYALLDKTLFAIIIFIKQKRIISKRWLIQAIALVAIRQKRKQNWQMRYLGTAAKCRKGEQVVKGSFKGKWRRFIDKLTKTLFGRGEISNTNRTGVVVPEYLGGVNDPHASVRHSLLRASLAAFFNWSDKNDDVGRQALWFNGS
ncbi:hypothetical protein ABC3322 [Shouchella clausii KSM-K16]|uniref:Uncharacterized protein n=1 Tax=Shouchella clausii (strain KSM-K16) TaxID=66692 RepID=Q5WCQ5_SHOC1|nr:hypothetical protein ABC3322 [Shouchella clausii KSM-K16]